MSVYLDDFNRLLSTPKFWEDDIVQDAEEAAARLDADDWASIIVSWNQKTEQDKENLFATLGDVVHPSLVKFAFILLSASDADKISEGLAILSFASPKLGHCISSSDIETIAAIWRENPNHRIGIQQMLWSKGKAWELRRFLSS